MSSGDGFLRDHPLAWRALAVAFVLQATTVACLYGPFAVLLPAVEARTGAARDVSSLGMLLVSLSSACLAPFAGKLADRLPLRLLAAVGVLLGSSGYALLAFVPNIQAFLAAYGLLVGPGTALTSIVVPSVLVTRWFQADRGRALGILHMPLLALVSPIAVTYLLKSSGAQAAYLLLAGAMACNLLLVPLLADRPPSAGLGAPHEPPAASRPGLRQVVAVPAFWALSLAVAAAIAASATVNTHLVPMVTQWGISDTRAASLLSLGALAGAIGAYLFGWVADRLGGGLTLALCCCDMALLCGVLLLQPGYAILAPVVALIGLHIAGAVPAYTLALSRIVGQDAFAVAFGLGSFVFMVLSPFMTPVAGAVFVRTHSYAPALLLLIVVLGAGGALALAGGGRRGLRPALAGQHRAKIVRRSRM